MQYMKHERREMENVKLKMDLSRSYCNSLGTNCVHIDGNNREMSVCILSSI